MKNKYLKVAKISEAKFRVLVDCFSEDIAATQAARLSRVNRNTAQRIYTLLRHRILSLASEENKPFIGEVEVDESYFGARRVRGKRGRGASGKTPVVGLLKRNGKVFVEVVKDCSRKELLPVIKGQVMEDSTVYTDGWKAYDSLVREGYKHHRVHHHKNEFARGKNHVNGIESFWSYVKFRMTKLRGVKREKFVTHLLESAWRFNHKKENIYLLLLKNLRENPL
jgi:transposase-like protein